MNKQAVAKCFSQAANSYDAAAHLQRRVADELCALVGTLPLKQGVDIVDLGTGTGYCLPFLAERFNPSQLTALDLSSEMLNVAARRVAGLNIMVGDLEAAPFPELSLDLAVSSLAVQWLDQPELFIANIAKTIKPGGYLALATLGSKTLWELKQAWAQVDSCKHVNDFHRAADWIEAVWQSDFKLELWREERIEVKYSSPLNLLQELKAIGANHVDRTGVTTNTSLRKMLRVYERFGRQSGYFPATWDVFYLIARKL